MQLTTAQDLLPVHCYQALRGMTGDGGPRLWGHATPQAPNLPGEPHLSLEPEAAVQVVLTATTCV